MINFVHFTTIRGVSESNLVITGVGESISSWVGLIARAREPDRGKSSLELLE